MMTQRYALFLLATLLPLSAGARPSLKTRRAIEHSARGRTIDLGSISYSGYGGMKAIVHVQDATDTEPARVTFLAEKAPAGVPSPTAGWYQRQIVGAHEKPLHYGFKRDRRGKAKEFLRYSAVVQHRDHLQPEDITALGKDLFGSGYAFHPEKGIQGFAPGSGEGEFTMGDGRGIEASWQHNAKRIEVRVKASELPWDSYAKAERKAEMGEPYGIYVRNYEGQSIRLIRSIAVDPKSGEIVHTLDIPKGTKLDATALEYAIDRLAIN